MVHEERNRFRVRDESYDESLSISSPIVPFFTKKGIVYTKSLKRETREILAPIAYASVVLIDWNMSKLEPETTSFEIKKQMKMSK